MKLRQWQTECINLALNQFKSGKHHFLALATPGAGKTMMASELADQLFKSELVDLVICFSPSTIVAKDFCESLHSRTKERFDGLIGAKGRSLTYQNLQYLDSSFWQLFERYRTFVIFDEVHHCAGSNIDNANAWGEQIILNIQDKAEFTLALTGTPWRSDASPIVLSNYIHPSNKIQCDYVYGLSEAILDKVCRVPQIIAVDNSNISVTDNGEVKTFNGFKSLLTDSNTAYLEVIENESVMEYIIKAAQKKLSQLRAVNHDAAGLIVASSVEHAKKIAHMMENKLNEKAVIVTYKEHDSTTIIQQFRYAQTKWIISVGMISEGTNIPRLQICCHLTNIKTEMHFRQILGRILRITASNNQEAIMYMPAEPKLLDYAYRVKQDIPSEADIVSFDTMKNDIQLENEDINLSSLTFDEKRSISPLIEDRLSSIECFSDVIVEPCILPSEESVGTHFLTRSYENVMNVYGRFRQEAIALGLSDLR
jgi:superfamily II DNA or RNA helicase